MVVAAVVLLMETAFDVAILSMADPVDMLKAVKMVVTAVQTMDMTFSAVEAVVLVEDTVEAVVAEDVVEVVILEDAVKVMVVQDAAEAVVVEETVEAEVVQDAAEAVEEG